MTTTSGMQLATPALSAGAIVADPSFIYVQIELAKFLIGVHTVSPRLARLKASHRKALLTHAGFALHHSRRPEDPLSGLTTTRFSELAVEYGAASRNTAAAFLAELIAYRFLRYVPGIPDRRVRILEVTEVADEAMRSWFVGHLRCLDQLDGGNRVAVVTARPELYRVAQARASAMLCTHPAWAHPPAAVMHFEASELGGLVLSEIISRIESPERIDGRLIVSSLGLSEIADRYGISVTNVKLMFNKAQDDGLLGWERPRRKGYFWMSERLIDDCFRWQAEKFAVVDAALRWAVESTQGGRDGMMSGDELAAILPRAVNG